MSDRMLMISDLALDEVRAERDRLKAINGELLYSLKIFIHAHHHGNSVPPNLEAQARAAIAKATEG